ncbi:metallophosphoesterase [Candidatus Woesearchaeota archaeon]|nr:metallophosphoesterase [Candidatus Woesearchaeota archaeon]
MVFIVSVSLMQYVNSIASDTSFEKRFTAIDMALITSVVHYAPGTLRYVYTVPARFDINVEAEFVNSDILLEQPGTELSPVKYWFLSGKNMDPFEGIASLQWIQDETEVPSPPEVIFYRTGRGVSFNDAELNPLHIDCPYLNTTDDAWASKTFFVGKVLQGSDASDIENPANRIAQVLSSRYSNFVVDTSPVTGGSLISAIPPDADIAIIVGDSGEMREPGSLVIYFPVSEDLINHRKLACMLVNDLLTPDTEVYYAQVMPVYTDSLPETSGLRIFKEASNPDQLMVFIDVSKFTSEQIDVNAISTAIYTAIARYYGGDDLIGSSAATFMFETVAPDISAQQAGVMSTQAQQAGSLSGQVAGTAESASALGSVADTSCLILYGDSRGSPNTHQDVVNTISEECDSPSLFSVGDMVGAGHFERGPLAASQWSRFLTIERDLISKGRIYPLIGNHEDVEGVSHYLGEEFPYVREQMSNNGMYVQQVTGNLLFIGLNTEESPEDNLVFLTAQLNSNPQKDVMVGFHKPYYPQIEHAPAGRYAVFHDLLAAHKNRGNKVLVFTGHTHGMSLSEKDGVKYLEVGSTAVPLRPCGNAQYSGVRRTWCRSTIGYVRCNSNLECVAKRRDGRTFNEFEV